MQFLWSLLPGAREARNQVVIGYAWLGVLALWFGVPDIDSSGNVGELIDAIGRVGVGVAVSFGAFMLGSVLDDVASPLVNARHAKGFTSGSAGGMELLVEIGDLGRSELERLEGSIDRASSELSLRAGLLPPLVLAFLVAVFELSAPWWACALLVVVAIALLFQITLRQLQLRNDLVPSNKIRSDALSDMIERQTAATDERWAKAQAETFRPASDAQWQAMDRRLQRLKAEEKQLQDERERLLTARGLGRMLLKFPRISARYAPGIEGEWNQ